MFFILRSISLILIPILLVANLFSSFAGSSRVQAQADQAFVREERILELRQTGITNPAGLAFSLRANTFYMIEARNRGQSISNLVKLTPFADRAGVARIAAAIQDPRNMAFDERYSRMLIFQFPSNQLVEVLEDANGNLDPSTVVRRDGRRFGLQDPQGLTVDPDSGALYFVDSGGARLVKVQPGADGSFDGAAVSIANLDLGKVEDIRGLALDPATKNLHLLSGQMLIELNQDGRITAERNLAEIGLDDPQGMVFAPSGDLTDDPSTYNLYVTNQGASANPESSSRSGGTIAGLDASIQTNASAEDGNIVELSFEPLPSLFSLRASAGTLIRTVDTSLYSPPSPDPSGVAYISHTGRLLFSDSEVNEMPQYFTGDNLFEVTLEGSLFNTLTTVHFSDEPTGVAYNPLNQYLYFSDDTGTRSVYILNPGPDGLYETADDIVTSFRTGDFSSTDPEGLTYDPVSGVLFIVDGVNREVYKVHPGANGVFDGVPPRGDDLVSQFDTLVFGLDDPEGVAFNPITGTLYLVGKPRTTLFEVTTDGDLVQTIDLSEGDPRKPAGLTVGPSSIDPTELSLYLVARGVDNDSDPDENDGKLFEYALGMSSGAPTNTPTSTNTPEPQPSPTNTLVPQPSPTNTLVPQPSPTNTLVPQPSPTNTLVPQPSPTNTLVPQPSSTNTLVPQPSSTNTLVPQPSSTNTLVPQPSSTNTPEPQPSPTFTNTPPGPPADITLAPVADARVLQSSPDSNYGTITRLYVDSPGEESYLRFNVSGVTGPIQSATLRLWVTNGSVNGPSLYFTSSGWTETGLTWNNRPAPTGSPLASVGSIASNAWAEFDLTGVITGDGSYDFALLPDSTDGATFYAREGSTPPQLVLSFTSDPLPTPTNTATPGPTATFTSTPTPGPSPTATHTPSSDGVIFVGAGDIADCNRNGDDLTAMLLDNIPGAVFTAGDNAYPLGSTSSFNNCYQPTWGRHKDRTWPAPGDNDYDTENASGYFNYFGAAAGDPTKGYYSYDLGEWHIIVLNSECSAVGGCRPSSPQGQWLRADLSANQKACILAIHHEPLFSSNGGDDDLVDFWEPLYEARADVVLSGHRHNYERFAQQSPDGNFDPGRGIRQFVVGTGGSQLSTFDRAPIPNSQVRNDETHGVLKFTLYPDRYEWEFIPVAGQTFTDSGSTACVTPQ